jgi:pimeloyl-ACP methyl ester carboxylesterase
VESYAMPVLAGDIVAVIRHLGPEKSIIVGHDWGGAIAWYLATTSPAVVERLIICNLPHFRGLRRELANNPEQQQNSQYARDFQQEGAHLTLRPERLTRWVTDPEAMPHYIEAFKKSDFEAMLNIYKANYPREPYVADSSPVVKVQCPVLMIHGLKDRALLPGALNDTWDWLEKDLTLVTIPDSEHFVQQDAADLVTRTMRMWLNR